jgi:hypothetical protein
MYLNCAQRISSDSYSAIRCCLLINVCGSREAWWVAANVDIVWILVYSDPVHIEVRWEYEMVQVDGPKVFR